MRKKKPILLRIAALAMAVTMLAGCKDMLLDTLDAPPDLLNKTISSDSKWINSNIDGSIDEGTTVSLKDDFYTAVNKDKFLATTLKNENDMKGPIADADEQVNKRLYGLVKMDTNDTTGLDTEVMSADTLIHLQELVHDFYDLVSDTSARDSMGCEPLRKYIDSIRNISNLDGLNAYLEDVGSANLFGITLLPVSLTSGQTPETEDRYTVYIDSLSAPLSLGNASAYMDVDPAKKEYSNDITRYALGSLGYTDGEINSIIKGCYSFEIKLARNMNLAESDNITNGLYDRDSLQELAGNYPILGVIDAYGYGASELYTVDEPVQVKNVAKIYTEANLDDIKDYLIVHTIQRSTSLLDTTIYEKTKVLNPVENNEDEEKDEDDPTDEEELAFSRTFSYLTDAVQQVYIAHYCTAEEKEQITEMTLMLINAHKELLSKEDWLSDQTREKAIEKLSNTGIHVLYPDVLTDYGSLDLSDCNNLIDAVARINAFESKRYVGHVNAPVDQNYWDFSIPQFATTVANAYNFFTGNSIYILAGIVSSKDVYDVDQSLEYNLGRLGAVVGHELSHSFDSNGYSFDKYGLEQDWWTAEDREAFEIKTSTLEKYYSALTPVTGNSAVYSGKRVSGEAIADMGGVRSCLQVAQNYDDFDYDTFFRSFASLWFTKYSYITCCASFTADEHPLGFLRANVTLAQFDEFQKTYDIQPGDGMYIAPEDRVAIW